MGNSHQYSNRTQRGEQPVFDALLDLLKKNKQMPNYAAERRIDLLINLFLEKILSAHYDENVVLVAPEFPLNRGRKDGRSYKLDYLCAFQDTGQPIFVELKTDALSFDPKRARFYWRQAQRWPDCISDLKATIEGNMPFSYRTKYFALIRKLLSDGIVELRGNVLPELDGLAALITKKDITREEKLGFRGGLLDLCDDLDVRWKGPAELFYIGPADNKMRMQLDEICAHKKSHRKKPPFVDFAQMADLPIRNDMTYRAEYLRLADFLKSPT